MGGQPQKSDELRRKGNSEETYVFDKVGLRRKQRSESCRRSPRRSGSRSVHVKEGVLRLKQGPHYYKGQGQSQRNGTFQQQQRSGLSYLPAHTQTKNRSHSKVLYNNKRNYEIGHCNARYCKYYEKQYERDLLKRNVERLPLLEYTYKQGRPLRGILKKPQFVRKPRMDELIFVEVGIRLHTACC
jgi:hypothetical protein